MNCAEATQEYDADVIVVGAGPIGLTTSNALRHHGVSCLLLEERTDVKAYSRANNLWARPQELLAGIGLRDVLAENSYAIHTINFSVNGTPTTPIPIADVASPYPKVLYSGQDVIERTLIGEFEARGGQLDRGCTVTDVFQDETTRKTTLQALIDDAQVLLPGSAQDGGGTLAQYILLTPHDISSVVVPGDHIKVHRLADPQKKEE